MANAWNVGKAGWFALLEARPIVQVVYLLRFCVGGLLSPSAHHVVTGAVISAQASWFTATWFVYLANGISDISGDRENGSHRPLASGRLSKHTAQRWCVGLVTASVTAAVFVGWAFFASDLVMLCLGFLYSFGPFPLKQRGVTASLTVGVAGFITYPAAAIAYRGSVDAPVLEFAAIMAIWMASAGNMKDFGDVDGDALAHRKTLPIAFGERRARRVILSSCWLTAIAGAATATAQPQLWPLWILVLAAVLMSVPPSKLAAHKRPEKFPYRVFMLSQFAVNGAAVVVAGIMTAIAP